MAAKTVKSTKPTDEQLLGLLNILREGPKLAESVGLDEAQTKLLEALTLDSEFDPRDFGIDSLDQVEIIMVMEEVFMVEIPDEWEEKTFPDPEKKKITVREALLSFAELILSQQDSLPIWVDPDAERKQLEMDETKRTISLASVRANHPRHLVFAFAPQTLYAVLGCKDDDAQAIIDEFTKVANGDPDMLTEFLNVDIFTKRYEAFLRQRAAKKEMEAENQVGKWVFLGGKYDLVSIFERGVEPIFTAGLPEPYTKKNGWEIHPKEVDFKFIPPFLALKAVPNPKADVAGRFIVLARHKDGTMIVSSVDRMDPDQQRSFEDTE